MDGIHDLGGMHGFGPVEREEHEPAFHADWEKAMRSLDLTIAVQKLATVAEGRHAIERMDPMHYLSASYYERWLDAAERLLVEKGVVSASELADRVALLRANPGVTFPHREDSELVERLRAASFGRRTPRHGGPQPRFAVGGRVVTRNMHPIGHTRLSRYARGKRGVIHQVRGIVPLADASARGHVELQVVYSANFDGHELWGDSADPAAQVYLDLWESYLEPDDATTT